MSSYLKYFCLLGLLYNGAVLAQTGINTRTPDPSSALDITASDKGILLPQYELSVLNSITTPVANPVTGCMIYNIGATNANPKGYYYWSGTMWERLIINNEMDQILKVSIANNSTVVIPSGTGDNYVSFENLGIVNTIPGVNFTGGQNVTLPKGVYRVDVTFDCRSQGSVTGTAAKFIAGYNFFAVNATLVDASNVALTATKVNSTISTDTGNSIQGYKFSFILTLTSATPTIVKLKLNHDAGASETSATQANQAGLVMTFYKFL